MSSAEEFRIRLYIQLTGGHVPNAIIALYICSFRATLRTVRGTRAAVDGGEFLVSPNHLLQCISHLTYLPGVVRVVLWKHYVLLFLGQLLGPPG